MLARITVGLVLALLPLQDPNSPSARRPASPDGGPVISHAPVTRLRAGEDLVVETTVTGPRKIARVSVSFHVGDRFGDAALQSAGATTWRGQVPASRLGRTFAYIIHASDEGGRVATFPEPPARPVTVVVGEDAAR